ncbi:hypothetical protein D6D22_02772 [Aureobasidium pullulans]|uniref:Galactosyl transferase GMA12/MNN10 family protein n=1 Tax=Aureobasidium pullulans TaxID=5580 RepID=A0A4S8Y109_AURPU|nr:hypothetical protein D6D22_02772 [Aureobasidium pullulans]
MTSLPYDRLQDEEEQGTSHQKPFHDIDIDEQEIYPSQFSRLREHTPRWLSTKVWVVVGSTLVVFAIFFGFKHTHRANTDNSLSLSSPYNIDLNTTTNPYKISKVSMLYGDNDLYERALQSHIRHADRWGYPTKIWRQDDGCGFWNKPTFLMSLVTKELAKPEKERMEWLMWVDADSIILNPTIPAHMFLPPPGQMPHVQFVGTRDAGGLNTGIFFLRIGPWAIHMLLDSMAIPLCHPTLDLGRNADQEAMARVFQKTSGGIDGNGYKSGVVYMPRHLFNSYELRPNQYEEFENSTIQEFPGWSRRHGYEGHKGDLLVHFPGLEGADRKPLMGDWLDVVEKRPEEWIVPVQNTSYVKDTREFWNLYAEALEVLREAARVSGSKEAGVVHVGLTEAMHTLRVGLSDEADDEEKIREYMKAVQEKMSVL